MKITGFNPDSVCLELAACEVPVLVNELLHRVRASGDSLLDIVKVQRRQPAADELVQMSDWLVEYRSILSAIGEAQREASDTPVSFATPFVVADSLVRACCVEAVEQPREAVGDPAAPRGALVALARVAFEWTCTLADLRHLDTGGVADVRL